MTEDNRRLFPTVLALWEHFEFHRRWFLVQTKNANGNSSTVSVESPLTRAHLRLHIQYIRPALKPAMRPCLQTVILVLQLQLLPLSVLLIPFGGRSPLSLHSVMAVQKTCQTTIIQSRLHTSEKASIYNCHLEI